MGKYKTVIIDLKKFIKHGAVLALTVAVSAGTILTLNKTASPQRILEQGNPIIKAVNSPALSLDRYISEFLKGLSRFVFGYVPADTASVLQSVFPVYRLSSEKGVVSVRDYTLPKKPTAPASPSDTGADIPTDKRAPIKAIDASKGATAIGNETSYSVDIDGMLASAPVINMDADGPKVLIIHTHATESYAPTGAEFYDKTASDRSKNSAENVVAVGKRLAEVLNAKGIDAIHDTALHDVPSFNGSYAHSLASAEEYISKHPSIQMVLDIHRDSIVYADDTKAKTVTEINGRDSAQLMFVVGTDQNGLTHPNWRNNLKTALHLQSRICAKYPKLMRHINLRRERFNGHTTGASVIIEAGTSGNSLDEALYSIELAGNCIADYLNDYSVSTY